MATTVRSSAAMTADKVKFRGKGVSFTAIAGTETAHDFVLPAARLLDGVHIMCQGQAFGDSMIFQVVDKDNVLGFGAGVVLQTFGDSWYISSDDQDQGQIRLPYSAEIYAGLYLRFKYLSTGTSDVSVCCNLFLHEYLA